MTQRARGFLRGRGAAAQAVPVGFCIFCSLGEGFHSSCARGTACCIRATPRRALPPAMADSDDDALELGLTQIPYEGACQGACQRRRQRLRAKGRERAQLGRGGLRARCGG